LKVNIEYMDDSTNSVEFMNQIKLDVERVEQRNTSGEVTNFSQRGLVRHALVFPLGRPFMCRQVLPVVAKVSTKLYTNIRILHTGGQSA